MPVLALSKVTVLEPEVNVPPVFSQLPETVNVPDGAVKVPEETVTTPLTSRAPEPPVNVPPSTVSAAAVVSSAPGENVPPEIRSRVSTSSALVSSESVPLDLLTRKVSKSLPVSVPPALSVISPLPSKVTVPELEVKVPEFAQLPLAVMAALVSGFRIPSATMVTTLKSEAVVGWNWPSVTVSVPATVTAAEESTSTESEGDVAVLLMVRLLKVSPVKVWAEDEARVTVPELWVKVPLVRDQLPPTVKVSDEPGAVRVPPEMVRLLLTAKVSSEISRVPAGTAKLIPTVSSAAEVKVPPAPLMVKLL